VGELPTRYFVVHHQKTAGTTLRDRFRASFPETAVYPNATDGKVGHSVISVSNLLERWAVRGDELRVVAGHFPLSTVELLGADFVTLTVLRPPVERTISYLRHQQRLNPRDRRGSLADVYDDPFRFHGLIRNHMTRMLSIGAAELAGGDGVLTSTPDTADRLERAKAALAGLDAFGLQPRFEEFWAELAERFGLDPAADARSNVGAGGDDEEPPADLVERIVEDNALDIELYDYAEELYDSRRR
jgi:hypothetical protein